MTFVMWILGALVASAGTAVYLEFGTVRTASRSCIPFHRDLGTPEKWRGEDLHGVYLSPTKIHDNLLLRGVWIPDGKSYIFSLKIMPRSLSL
jgi:hypothetical protein